MRIDKYLWCVRYYKTRTLATTACKKGQVRVNQEIVKPSREVYPQDIIELRKDQIKYKLTVNDIPESRVGAKLVDIYRTDTTPKEQFEAQELLKYSKDYYRKKGVGRPTKKDRRDIDGFTDETSTSQTDSDGDNGSIE
jgi:ribosome-associated heat shock protein Hsp15